MTNHGNILLRVSSVSRLEYYWNVTIAIDLGKPGVCKMDTLLSGNYMDGVFYRQNMVTEWFFVGIRRSQCIQHTYPTTQKLPIVGWGM